MSQYNPQAFWDSAALDPDVRYKYIADEWAVTEDFLQIIENCNTNWGSVLEIGCGIGRLLDPLSDKYETCQFYGVDISPQMMKLAPKKHNITYSQTIDVDNLDMVYSMLVLQHITKEDKIKYIIQAYEALKPNGVFLFQFVEGEEDSPYSYQEYGSVIYTWLELSGFKNISIRKGFMHPDWSFAQAIK